jgi:hypothetical protein
VAGLSSVLGLFVDTELITQAYDPGRPHKTATDYRVLPDVSL